MINLHEEYVVDEKGNRKAILLPYEEWKKIIEELEELEDIRLYDKAKKEPSDPIQFDTAIKEIQKGRLS
jgi:PHD/YefM family antitoxin component YafN of YafNO toxin-antitoxin module